MLVLNLGCGAPDKRSWHPIDGAINRDPGFDGWRFENGLGEYANGSVDGITISHAIMYLPLDKWPALFAELGRVLKDGGVLRVTEDNTTDPKSRTFKRGWHDVVTLTDPGMVKRHMLAAGLVPHDCDAYHSTFKTDILMQRCHGDAPHCFWLEGTRSERVLFAPHCDDETLFGAFTILQHRPTVVTCFDSSGDYGSDEEREAETADALAVLGAVGHLTFHGGDIAAKMREYDAGFRPSLVFAPHPQCSHPDHLVVAEAAREVFGDRLRTYHTYDQNGKVRDGAPAPYEPVWIQAKLRALARYESQISHPRAHRFFMESLDEYLGE